MARVNSHPAWSISAICLYVLFFLETVATVFYYLGWMNNYVFTISPLVLMILTIIQTSLYLIAWVLFFIRMLPGEFGRLFGNAGQKSKWNDAQLAQCTAHVGVTFILSAAGLIMSAVWYGKYNGTYGTPVYSDGDSYIWFKNIFLWMTFVWGVEMSRLFMMLASWRHAELTAVAASATNSMISKVKL
jgi:hypothetical protein